MSKFRDRLVNMALGPEKRQVMSAFRGLLDYYLAGPFEPPTSPEALRRMLGEYDSSLVQDLVNEIEWERIGGQGYDLLTGEDRRIRAVQENRRLWIYDVITPFVVQLWTDFGFGENVKLTPADEGAKQAWDEYWQADRNDAVLAQDNIQALSETLLVDGELFLAYYASTLDGTVTVRPIDNLEITEVIADPGDSKKALLYRRRWVSDGQQQEALYPAWQPWFESQRREEDTPDPFAKLAGKATIEGVKRADAENQSTTVVVQHIAYKRRGGMRGWPLMTAGAPWSREHRRFRENRASVAAAMAMYVQKIKAKGGNRAIDQIRAKLQSSLAAGSSGLETNPPAPAGSTFLENEAATLERMPMGTGASDAKEDGAALLLMAGLGGGVYPHWLGAGEYYRLATATAMEAPMHRQFSRYKLFWSAQLRRMLKIVLAMAELYGNKQFGTTQAEVTSDRLIEVDLQMVSDSVTGLVDSALTPYFDGGLVDDATAGRILAAIWQIALQALGVEDPNEVAPDTGFGVETQPEEGAARETMPPFGGARTGNRRGWRNRLRAQERAWNKRARRTVAGRLLREAGWQGMAEAGNRRDDFGRGLRAAARGLWNGAMSRADSMNAFILTLQVGLRWAWIEGMAAVGIPQEAITQADWDVQAGVVNRMMDYLSGLLDFIEEHSKAKGGAWATVVARLAIWENRYAEVMAIAKVSAASDPPLEWRMGATKEHCRDCLNYHGRVYRASVWWAWGAVTQSRALACHGHHCQCQQKPTRKPLNRGHPPAPTGE